MKRSSRRVRQVAGFALLEALVAVLVSCVGFIGAVRMQTLGMKMNTSSQLRQKAVLLTYQMTDRIRANRTGFGSGAYDNPSVGSMTCLSTGCTPAQLAVADMTARRSASVNIAVSRPSGRSPAKRKMMTSV